jgi:hypothetical protein
MEATEELQIWIGVNSCETPQALSEIIISLADDQGKIQGRNKKFNAEEMSEYVIGVVLGDIQPSVLTREYGIRQQALYLREYKKYGE